MQIVNSLSLMLILGCEVLSGSIPVRTTQFSHEMPKSTTISEGSVAVKFDEFVTSDLAIDDIKARLDEFYDRGLKNRPKSVAYIIVYRGKYRRSRYSPTLIRNYLVLRKLPRSLIRTINGGYREQPTIELWVVPDGADSPPTASDPFPSSKKRKLRVTRRAR